MEYFLCMLARLSDVSMVVSSSHAMFGFAPHETGSKKVSTFLNRILALRMVDQASIFSVFSQYLDAHIAEAKSRAAYDDGIVTLKAESIELEDNKLIHEEPGTGCRGGCAVGGARLTADMDVSDNEGAKCGACGSGRAKSLLLCDGTSPSGRACPHAYHTTCLDRPLDAIPAGDWLSAPVTAARVGSGTSGRAGGLSMAELATRQKVAAAQMELEAKRRVHSYDFTVDNCVHCASCTATSRGDACTFGKRIRSEVLVTGSVLPIWQTLFYVVGHSSYDKRGRKRPKILHTKLSANSQVVVGMPICAEDAITLRRSLRDVEQERAGGGLDGWGESPPARRGQLTKGAYACNRRRLQQGEQGPVDFLSPESPVCRTPWQVISNAPGLSFLSNAVLKAGLTSKLDDASANATLFAPVDAGWADLLRSLNKTTAQLLADPTLLPIVLDHVVPGARKAPDLASGVPLATVLQESLMPALLTAPDNTTRLQIRTEQSLANVVKFDTSACQTVVHEVDQVLVPAFLAASADGPAITLVLGSGTRFRMEYPPVVRSKPPIKSLRGSAAAASLASILIPPFGGSGGLAEGGAPGPDAYGRVGWGGPLTASKGLTDAGVRYSVLAAPSAPAPA
ncbi:hypothetical protein WJX81_000322 [Elliptochloris bilobata]|uniref:FAS1 domain-containing protein n=1 Tax=Elliptochloris bilobata TaxID=381761 RepID=A0AAW1RR54_9CHLO